MEVIEPLPQPALPRLLNRVRDSVRRRHYSRRTEEQYVHWIKRFIYFTGKRHPERLGAEEVTAFLNHLASERRVAAATQNQALSALLFLYKEVLVQPLPTQSSMPVVSGCEITPLRSIRLFQICRKPDLGYF